MLTRMRVRRQLWGQLRRQSPRVIAPTGNSFLASVVAKPRALGSPVTAVSKFRGDAAALGFGNGVQQHGLSSSSSPPPSMHSSHQPQQNRVLEEFESKAEATLGGSPEFPEKGEAPGSKRGHAVFYVAGAGTIALVTLVAASTDVFEAPDATAHVEAGLSAVYNSGAGIGRELVKMAGSIKEATVDTFVDFVEAIASIWVLIRCLSRILDSSVESVTWEMSSWWRPRVASLLADLAAQESRRKAIVEAGDGLVVDWLLKAVGGNRPSCPFTQAEASRALAFLLSDVNTSECVLGRPHALPYLLHFAASLHMNDAVESLSSGRKYQGTMEWGGVSRGKSLLVAAIVDLVTSSCECGDASSGFRPMLPGKADPADVAVALQVVEGGWLVDDGGSEEKSGKDRGGLHGIGIRVLGGTEIVGVQRTQACVYEESTFSNLGNKVASLATSLWPQKQHPLSYLSGTNGVNEEFQFVQKKRKPSSFSRKRSSDSLGSSYGLWDDLPGRFVAVPLAAWALATWARVSSENRSIITQLDKEGDALLATVVAPERSVRWHGATAMKFLLQNVDKEFDDVAARWSSALLTMASQACLYKDLPLAHSALTSLTACISHSQMYATAGAHMLVIGNGLPVLRQLAKETESDDSVQGALAQSLDVLTATGFGLSLDEGKKWSSILLRWVCIHKPDSLARSCGCRVLNRVVNNLGQGGIPISQAWLAMLLMDIVTESKPKPGRAKMTTNAGNEARERGLVQSERIRLATAAASEIAKVVAREAEASTEALPTTDQAVAESARELPMVDLLGFDMSPSSDHSSHKETRPKITAREAAQSTLRAVKALTELIAEDQVSRQRIIEAGGLCLLRRLLLCDDFDQWAAAEDCEGLRQNAPVQSVNGGQQDKSLSAKPKEDITTLTAHIRKHATRLLAILSLHPSACLTIAKDQEWCTWLESCAQNHIDDNKLSSYARAVLYHVSKVKEMVEDKEAAGCDARVASKEKLNEIWPRYEDNVYLMNSDSVFWGAGYARGGVGVTSSSYLGDHSIVGFQPDASYSEKEENDGPLLDVVFVHGLMGGPYRTWRIADDKTSTASVLIEKIDEDAGKAGTCWPEEWLAADLPGIRLLTVKYKTNLSQWSGATLPLQEVSSTLLDKLLAAGIGERPIVFVTHSMGGLVVKQLLLQASQDENRAHLVKQTSGMVFYSCPHSGSKLADMPWRLGYVLRPAPSIGDLRSGSPKLEELNRYIRQLHTKRGLDVLSFSETKVTPLVEGYGGYGLRMEVVPIESAYPGFGELVLLDGTDHINSCKPLNRSDPAYSKTLQFLQKLAIQAGEAKCKKG